MKEFVATKGGRKLYIEDIEYLQDLALANSEIYRSYGNFVITGCEPSISGDQLTIADGFVYINGKVRQFAKQTFAVPEGKIFYIGEVDTTYTTVYQDNTTNPSRVDYACGYFTELNEEQYGIQFKYDNVLQEWGYSTYMEKAMDYISNNIDRYVSKVLSSWVGSKNLTTCEQGTFKAGAVKDVDETVTQASQNLPTSAAVWKFLKEQITVDLVSQGIGYVPFDSAQFSQANIKSTLGISDWAMMKGVKQVVSLENITNEYAVLYCERNTNGGLLVSTVEGEKLVPGQSVTIVVKNTSSSKNVEISMPIATTGYTSLDGDKCIIPAGLTAEISVLCYAADKYSIAIHEPS